MDDSLAVVVEMAETIWKGFRRDLGDIGGDEADWRPLPVANSINLIVRHLRIEAEWHRHSLLDEKAMPHDTTEELLRQIDSVPVDFGVNLKALDEAQAAFLDALRSMSGSELQQRSRVAYRDWPPGPAHFLAYHQWIHLCMHWGQVRSIRNLYQKARGERARFHPDNPSFPRGAGAQG